jgi:hypothetical protein
MNGCYCEHVPRLSRCTRSCATQRKLATIWRSTLGVHWRTAIGAALAQGQATRLFVHVLRGRTLELLGTSLRRPARSDTTLTGHESVSTHSTHPRRRHWPFYFLYRLVQDRGSRLRIRRLLRVITWLIGLCGDSNRQQKLHATL